ncbi:MAG TPA: hypothetical protein VK763_10105 [Terriglobales bacterium]|jgi:hypothetical protein|nr:hypothetical protein [Terriglobales bacterium]
MKHFIPVCLLICASFAITQQATQDQSGSASRSSADQNNGRVTMRGCLGKFGEDYTLTRRNAEETYELQASKGIKLSKYLGQQVEVTGTKGPSMGTTAPNEAVTGSASPITITVTSVKTIEQKCLGPQFDAK